MKYGYAEIPEGQIHYVAEGNGMPLLLLHQTSGWSGEYIRILPSLSQSYKTIAMDSIGYGLSSLPDHPFSIQDHAKAVKEFLAVMGIRKTHLMGHHTGATIALEFAASNPDAVAKLILSGCPDYEPDVRKSKLEDPKFHVMVMDPEGTYIMDIWRRMRNSAPDASPEIWHEALIPRLMPGKRAEEGHRAVFLYDGRKRLSLLRCPTLLLSGTKDVFLSRIEHESKLIANCHVSLIKGAGGLIALTHPEELTRNMLDFLAS